MRLADGGLAFPGDTERVMDADVHYARAAGIDYFIFGYYLATASWGRDPSKAAVLNRSFEAYLRLRNYLGVGFAISFNWNFPLSDIPAASDVISHALAKSDYVHTRDGAAVVFFFVPNLTAWIAGFGGEAGAMQAVTQLRQQVWQATGTELYLVAMLFGLPQVAPTAMQTGFDAVSTYANALGTGGHAVPVRTMRRSCSVFLGDCDTCFIWRLPADGDVGLGFPSRAARSSPGDTTAQPRLV